MRSTRVSHPKTGLCSSSLTGRALRRLRGDCDPTGPGIKLKAEITRKQSRKADNYGSPFQVNLALTRARSGPDARDEGLNSNGSVAVSENARLAANRKATQK